MIRLSDLFDGDLICGFEHWGCVPDNAIREVCVADGKFHVWCKQGEHYLDSQTDDDGTLVGMLKVPAGHRGNAKKLLCEAFPGYGKKS